MHVECAKSPNRLGKLAEGGRRVGAYSKREGLLPFVAQFLVETKEFTILKPLKA